MKKKAPEKMDFAENNFFYKELAYNEFLFESEAKGDNLIGVHQTKVVKV